MIALVNTYPVADPDRGCLDLAVHGAAELVQAAPRRGDVLASLVPGDLGRFGWIVPPALVALYVLATLSPFSLPRRQNRENARGPR